MPAKKNVFVRPEKDITVSARVLRKCSTSSLILFSKQSLRGVLYIAQFLRYKLFCVLHFLRKIRKFKMAAILGRQHFLKIGMATLEIYPVGQKFHRNRSI